MEPNIGDVWECRGGDGWTIRVLLVTAMPQCQGLFRTQIVFEDQSPHKCGEMIVVNLKPPGGPFGRDEFVWTKIASLDDK